MHAATGEGPIEHLGQRELRLENGEVIPTARLAVRRGEGMRQAPEPLAKHGVDLVRDVLDPPSRVG